MLAGLHGRLCIAGRDGRQPAGLVLSDGEPVALWRARKQGRRLAVSVDAFGAVPKDALRAEAERLLPLRGCATLDLA